MLELEKKLILTRAVRQAPNLTNRFSDRDLTALGREAKRGYQSDKLSRVRWEQRNEAAMDLAMQYQKDKNFPWPNCSNVAFPLVTIAALQFHSRAYPALVDGPNIVQYRVVGDDPDGSEKARGERIGKHMSYQLLEEDQPWEEQHDRMLINVPIVGCAFKKSYYNAEARHNVSEFVMAQDLVINYYAKSVEDAYRKTHRYIVTKNDIFTGVRKGIYRDVLDEGWYERPQQPTQSTSDYRKDDRHGENPPAANLDGESFYLLEQHCWLDLDQDGYAEPYILTIEENSETVLRLVARWDRDEDISRNAAGQLIQIHATEYFTKYGFIPSPDGGIYDIGFGLLLGPLNESVDTLVNQLIDAGTMATTAGGFLGRGAKIRGGTYTFSPLEWKRVDSTGDDLKKSIFPLPVREPSAVLFQLLSLLINYTNRISGSSDFIMGENPGQNTPASTTSAMIEQGMKIYSAIFKRMWRSEKEEFKKIYQLNAAYMPVLPTTPGLATREDYLGNPDRIAPVADPNVASDSLRFAQARAVKEASMSTQGYNLPEVEKRYLRALHVDGIDQIFPGPGKVPPLPNFKVQVQNLKNQAQAQSLKLQQMKFMMELQETHRLNTAKIAQLEAQAAQYIGSLQGAEEGRQIAALEAAIGAMKTHDESIRGHIQLMLKAMEQDNARQSESPAGAGVEGMAGASSNQGNETGAGGVAGGA